MLPNRKQIRHEFCQLAERRGVYYGERVGDKTYREADGRRILPRNREKSNSPGSREERRRLLPGKGAEEKRQVLSKGSVLPEIARDEFYQTNNR